MAAGPWVGPDRRGRLYLACPACGFIFLSPGSRPQPAEARARYLLHRNSLDESGYRRMLEEFADKTILPFAPPGARALDFGSGPGPSLEPILRERGLEAYSWDPLFKDDPGALARSYAVLAMHEVIEHCADPLATLSKATGLLAPGGILAIATHFRPSEPSAFMSWWYRQDSTHVSFFTADCLSDACAGLGLSALFCDGKSASAFRKLPA